MITGEEGGDPWTDGDRDVLCRVTPNRSSNRMSTSSFHPAPRSSTGLTLVIRRSPAVVLPELLIGLLVRSTATRSGRLSTLSPNALTCRSSKEVGVRGPEEARRASLISCCKSGGSFGGRYGGVMHVEMCRWNGQFRSKPC